MTTALTCRYAQTNGYPELDRERLHLGTELLAMDSRPITTDATAHLLLMQANCARADFDAADLHTAEAERIIDAYNLPALATKVSFYRALRTAFRRCRSGGACPLLWQRCTRSPSPPPVGSPKPARWRNDRTRSCETPSGCS